MQTDYALLLEDLSQNWSAPADKPEETPESVLLALWHAATGRPVSAAVAADEDLPPLDETAFGRLRALVARRKEGTPLAHLTRRQSFMGLELLAGPEALIPRRETEILGRAALERLLGAVAAGENAPIVIDVCTGSGNLALALAWYARSARVHAADISPKAIALATRNAAHLGLGGRVSFAQGDLLSPFETPAFQGRCDLLCANPPYISAGKVSTLPPEISHHEPWAAFDGGALGVTILRRLVSAAPRFLRPGGWFAIEVGRGQGASMVRQLRRRGTFDLIETCRDEQGEVRAVLARARLPA